MARPWDSSCSSPRRHSVRMPGRSFCCSRGKGESLDRRQAERDHNPRWSDVRLGKIELIDQSTRCAWLSVIVLLSLPTAVITPCEVPLCIGHRHSGHKPRGRIGQGRGYSTVNDVPGALVVGVDGDGRGIVVRPTIPHARDRLGDRIRDRPVECVHILGSGRLIERLAQVHPTIWLDDRVIQHAGNEGPRRNGTAVDEVTQASIVIPGSGAEECNCRHR